MIQAGSFRYARSTSHEGEIIDNREHMAFNVRYHKLNARRSSEFGKYQRAPDEDLFHLHLSISGGQHTCENKLWIII
jgi:hypothetical protein